MRKQKQVKLTTQSGSDKWQILDSNQQRGSRVLLLVPCSVHSNALGNRLFNHTVDYALSLCFQAFLRSEIHSVTCTIFILNKVLPTLPLISSKFHIYNICDLKFSN